MAAFGSSSVISRHTETVGGAAMTDTRVPTLTSAPHRAGWGAGAPQFRSRPGDGSSSRRTRVVFGGFVSERGKVGHRDPSQVPRDPVVRAEHPATALQGVLAQGAGRVSLA